MPIDFFISPCGKTDGNCTKAGVVCTKTTNELKFGLCDDNSSSKLPAYIDLNNEDNWLATINNPQRKEITFKAIDFCVDIYRVGNELIKRCEGFLYFDNKILFIELKERQYKGWLTDACLKFEETINAFKQNHPDEFEILEPVVSNKKHFKTHQNLMIQQQRLKDVIGVTFQSQSVINID